MSSPSTTSTIELTPPEAFAAIALTAVAADGVIQAEEAQIIQTTLARMELFKPYSEDAKREMLDRLLGYINQQGYDTLLKAAIVKLPSELRETAFAVATDITLSDGDLAEEEENLLNDLYNSLKISEETATKIIDVLLIKNQG